MYIMCSKLATANIHGYMDSQSEVTCICVDMELTECNQGHIELAKKQHATNFFIFLKNMTEL